MKFFTITSTIRHFIFIAGGNLEDRCAWREGKGRRRQYQCFRISLPIPYCSTCHYLLSKYICDWFQCNECIGNKSPYLLVNFQGLIRISKADLNLDIKKENVYVGDVQEFYAFIISHGEVFMESLRLFITFPGINFPLWKMWIYSEAPAATDTLAYGDSAILQSLSK